MKKEYTLVTVIGLFLFAYILDLVSGPIGVVIRNPIVFLTPEILSRYPLTAVGIFARAFAVAVSVFLLMSVMEKKYFLKAIIVLIVTALSELYAIQQLATGLRTTPIQWTLSISYAGAIMAPALAFYIVKGIVWGVKEKVSPEKGPVPLEEEGKLDN